MVGNTAGAASVLRSKFISSLFQFEHCSVSSHFSTTSSVSVVKSRFKSRKLVGGLGPLPLRQRYKVFLGSAIAMRPDEVYVGNFLVFLFCVRISNLSEGNVNFIKEYSPLSLNFPLKVVMFGCTLWNRTREHHRQC